MNNFICLLDTTLKLNKENDKSDEDKTAEEDAEEEEEATLTPAKLMPCNNRTYVVEKLVVDDLDTPDIGDVMTPEEEPTPVVNVSATPVNILDPNVPMPARTCKNDHVTWRYSHRFFFVACSLVCFVKQFVLCLSPSVLYISG